MRFLEIVYKSLHYYIIMDLMRVESDLTGGGASIFTSPEEIKFEMATIAEVLEDNTGKLTQNQFSVHG
jgi:hypothetical protein